MSTPPPISHDVQEQPNRRQLFIDTAFVRAKITYTDRNKTVQPIRLVKVWAYGTVYSSDGSSHGRKSASAKLDIYGEALFTFFISSGRRIVVDWLTIKLESPPRSNPTIPKHYTIGTRKSATGSLVTQTLRLRLNFNPWNVTTGETKRYANRFPLSGQNTALAVNDAYQRLSSFAYSKVLRAGELENIDVWFPSEGGAFFSPYTDRYINMPQQYHTSPVS